MSTVTFPKSEIPFNADIPSTMAQYNIVSDDQVKIVGDTVYVKDPDPSFDPNNINWLYLPTPPEKKAQYKAVIIECRDWDVLALTGSVAEFKKVAGALQALLLIDPRTKDLS